MSDETAPKKRKGRSPNYPGIDLMLALDRAKTLWEHERHHAVPTELILKHWGYGPRSGGGSVAFSALKRFGLMEEAGNGRARLTPRAQSILLAEREGRREDALIREAALLPAMHKKMWEKHGVTLPSDENLKFELETEEGFTPGGAAEFLSEWKRTIKYAGLTASDGTVPLNAGEKPDPSEPQLTPPSTLEQPPLEQPPGERRQTRTVQVTYSPTEWALLQGQFPMSEDDWDAMIAVLDAMKRGLVTPSD
jgi:hypothetical protein